MSGNDIKKSDFVAVSKKVEYIGGMKTTTVIYERAREPRGSDVAGQRLLFDDLPSEVYMQR